MTFRFHWFWALGFPKNTKCSFFCSYGLPWYKLLQMWVFWLAYMVEWLCFLLLLWKHSLNEPFNFCVTEEGANLMGPDLSWAFKLSMTEHKALYIPCLPFFGLRCLPTRFSAYGLLMSCVGGPCLFSASTSPVYSSIRIKQRNNLPEPQTQLSTSLVHNSKNTTSGVTSPPLLIRIPHQCIISSTVWGSNNIHTC